MNSTCVDGLASTIIPVYNRPDQLKECVESVLAQTYRPIEIIIVDDGSTDQTGEVADDLANKSIEVISVHQSNSGVGAAREKGRLMATGEFIQYLDSDDILFKEKFNIQVDGLRKNPEAQISYCITRLCYSTGETISNAWKRTGETIETLFPLMLLNRWWGTSSPLYRRSVIDRNGPWLDLINEEDWEYDCRIARTGVKLHHANQVLSEQRAHRGERLSTAGTTDPKKLASRARAHELILEHARYAGIEATAPEMQHFSRELFLLARQCGAAGLHHEPGRLFSLSRASATDSRAKGFDYQLYHVGAALLGWNRIGSLSAMADKLRRS